MEILSGTDISSEVLKLIRSTPKTLLLVSAYFDPWERLNTEIKALTAKPGTRVVMLLRGGPEQKKHQEAAKDLASLGVRVSFLKRLHAKMYLNDTEVIVTSMNLLKSSALDSWEIAVRIRAAEDPAAFKKLWGEAAELLKRAQEEAEVAKKEEEALAKSVPAEALAAMSATAPPPKVVAKPPLPAPAPAATARPRIPALAVLQGQAAPGAAAAGWCVRCRASLPHNPEKPLCPTCYRSWATYQNPEYKENYCHTCGAEAATSMARPQCKPCWKAT